MQTSDFIMGYCGIVTIFMNMTKGFSRGRMRCATNTGYDENIDEAVCHQGFLSHFVAQIALSNLICGDSALGEHKPTTTGGPNWKFKSSSYRDHY